MAVRFYWYPSEGGTIEVADLPAISQVNEIPVNDRSELPTFDGGRRTVRFRSSMNVRLVLDRFSDPAVYRKLATMQAHLDRGGLVGFAADSTKAWCGYTRVLPTRGSTIVRVGGDVFYEAAAALADGDEVVIESSNPEAHREWSTVSGSVATNATSLTLATGAVYDYAVGPAWIRHRDFFPALKRPVERGGQPIVTTDRRLTYTLDVTLELDMEAMALAESFGLSRLRDAASGSRLGSSWASLESKRTFDARGGLSSPKRRGSG